MRSDQSHLSVIETWFRRVWTEQDPAAIDEMFRPEAKATGLGAHPLVGPEAFRAFHAALVAQMTDFEVTIDRSRDDGDWIWVLVSFRAACRRTAKSVTIPGQALVRIDSGRIVEAYNNFDFMGLFQQLGLLPEDALGRCLGGQGVAKSC